MSSELRGNWIGGRLASCLTGKGASKQLTKRHPPRVHHSRDDRWPTDSLQRTSVETSHGITQGQARSCVKNNISFRQAKSSRLTASARCDGGKSQNIRSGVLVGARRDCLIFGNKDEKN